MDPKLRRGSSPQLGHAYDPLPLLPHTLEQLCARLATSAGRRRGWRAEPHQHRNRPGEDGECIVAKVCSWLGLTGNDESATPEMLTFSA